MLGQMSIINKPCNTNINKKRVYQKYAERKQGNFSIQYLKENLDQSLNDGYPGMGVKFSLIASDHLYLTFT